MEFHLKVKIHMGMPFTDKERSVDKIFPPLKYNWHHTWLSHENHWVAWQEWSHEWKMRGLRIYTLISVRVDSTYIIRLYIEEAEEFVLILQKKLYRYLRKEYGI